MLKTKGRSCTVCLKKKKFSPELHVKCAIYVAKQKWIVYLCKYNLLCNSLITKKNYLFFYLVSSVQTADSNTECVDKPELANCDLIVYAQLCNNEYYSSFCCASCSKHGSGHSQRRHNGWETFLKDICVYNYD